MSTIPTSSSVRESAVIEAPLSSVWHLIKLQDFSQFWNQLKQSEFVKGASPDTDIVNWTFKDGTVLEVKQEEHSVSFLANLGRSSIMDSTNQGCDRPLIISSHTLSSALNQHCSTLLWSLPFVSTQSLLETMRAIPISFGQATSAAMPQPMSSKMPSTNVVKH